MVVKCLILRPIRIELKRLIKENHAMDSHKCIIIISHSNYRIKSAGVEKYITEVTGVLSKHNVHALQIFPVIELNRFMKRFSCEYVGINLDGEYQGVYQEDRLAYAIAELSEKNNLKYIGVHLNHLHGWNLGILQEFLFKICLPIKIIIHDYEMICADMLKEDGNGAVCRKTVNAPDKSVCNGCKYFENSYKRYERYKNFLANIQFYVVTVIAPSEVAVKNWLNGFEAYKDKVEIRNHLIFLGQKKRCIPNERLRIAYIGSTASHKGYKEWEQLVSQRQINNYDFYYFGKFDVSTHGVKKVFVDFQNKTEKSMVKQLIDHNIDIAFLWSTWNETYCYTACEAYMAGCFVITNNYSGNIRSLVEQFACGKVFDKLDSCVDFLTDSKQVYHAMQDFTVNKLFPRTSKPNDSISELIFDNMEFSRSKGNKETNTVSLKKRSRSVFLTELYRKKRCKY